MDFNGFFQFIVRVFTSKSLLMLFVKFYLRLNYQEESYFNVGNLHNTENIIFSLLDLDKSETESIIGDIIILCKSSKCTLRALWIAMTISKYITLNPDITENFETNDVIEEFVEEYDSYDSDEPILVHILEEKLFFVLTQLFYTNYIFFIQQILLLLNLKPSIPFSYFSIDDVLLNFEIFYRNLGDICMKLKIIFELNISDLEQFSYNCFNCALIKACKGDQYSIDEKILNTFNTVDNFNNFYNLLSQFQGFFLLRALNVLDKLINKYPISISVVNLWTLFSYLNVWKNNDYIILPTFMNEINVIFYNLSDHEQFVVENVMWIEYFCHFLRSTSVSHSAESLNFILHYANMKKSQDCMNEIDDENENDVMNQENLKINVRNMFIYTDGSINTWQSILNYSIFSGFNIQPTIGNILLLNYVFPIHDSFPNPTEFMKTVLQTEYNVYMRNNIRDKVYNLRYSYVILQLLKSEIQSEVKNCHLFYNSSNFISQVFVFDLSELFWLQDYKTCLVNFAYLGNFEDTRLEYSQKIIRMVESFISNLNIDQYNQNNSEFQIFNCIFCNYLKKILIALRLSIVQIFEIYAKKMATFGFYVLAIKAFEYTSMNIDIIQYLIKIVYARYNLAFSQPWIRCNQKIIIRVPLDVINYIKLNNSTPVSIEKHSIKELNELISFILIYTNFTDQKTREILKIFRGDC
ncbi:hypothetical protein A3Q56_02722 [Intoshia linei]|uniref:Uncharacterized protein n=1 Tax=Intoshia linei TaxID=1819745 RepID=A0A177B7X3_9BILA|nr:hypothetical protein A3Q56_02722 [Intoshia linei]